MEEEEALARRAGEGREAEDQVDQVDQAQAQADRVVGLLAAADTADTTIEGIGEVSSFSFRTIAWLEAFVVFFPFCLASVSCLVLVHSSMVPLFLSRRRRGKKNRKPTSHHVLFVSSQLSHKIF